LQGNRRNIYSSDPFFKSFFRIFWHSSDKQHIIPALTTLLRANGEHVHIISAGEYIHTAYPAIFRMLPTITRTYVLADSVTTKFSPSHETRRQRAAARDAVAAVKEISASFSIPFTSEIVYPPVYPSVRTILTKIHREHPGARFTLDLSGGSAVLCTALFSFVPWLGGGYTPLLTGKCRGLYRCRTRG
jgi:hypothetical protein